MPKRVITSVLLSFLTCGLAGCSYVYYFYDRPPQFSLNAGYYTVEGNGVYRRLIVTPGSIRISYDQWRVSTKANDNALHEHFDLVGDSTKPQSGWYEITQDGTDCGKAYLSPYIERGRIYNTILIMQYNGAWQPLESDPTFLEDYATRDRSEEYRIAWLAARKPNLYANFSTTDRKFYAELEPDCSY